MPFLKYFAWSTRCAGFEHETFLLVHCKRQAQPKYTTWPKVCGHPLVEHLIPKSWALIWSWSPFAAITASTLKSRLSTRYWNVAVGTCFHSGTRALMRSGTDVGRLSLARSRCSNSFRWFLVGLRSGLCTGHSSYSAPISKSHFCMDLALCTGHCHAETGKRRLQTVATNLEAQNRLDCHWML